MDVRYKLVVPIVVPVSLPGNSEDALVAVLRKLPQRPSYLELLRACNPAAVELFRAVIEGSAQDVRVRLATGDDPNARSHGGTTPIFSTVSAPQKLEKADALFKAGADPNVWDQLGMHPLHWAVGGALRDVSNVRWLLDRGVDPNVAVRPSAAFTFHPVAWRPLHIAADHAAIEVVELLIACGADPNQVADDGASPLHIAASKMRVYKRLIRALLDAGADMDAQDANGRTALHILAARWGRYRTSVIRLLRYRNARRDLRDTEGRLAIDLVPEESPATEELKRLLRPT